MEVLIHKYGDHVDTDVILPGRYLSIYDPAELARHCLEGLDPGFATRVRAGDVIVAGQNFGSGSSREHAPIAIKACGVAAVIARSFGRIFYRNAANIGLPLIVCQALPDVVQDGDRAEVDVGAGSIRFGGRSFEGEEVAPAVRAIVEAGGLVPYVRAKLSGGPPSS
jgi:3-isopropylmalate/(R)-2-methylmalate dehydratase small subunit